jgi:hypothetical protein
VVKPIVNLEDDALTSWQFGAAGSPCIGPPLPPKCDGEARTVVVLEIT